MEKRPFVLSGGGIRGVAHLGVLRAFNEAGIVPGVISGSSAGALVGALIADGWTPAEATELIREELKDRRRFIRRPSLVSKRIERFLRRNLRHAFFEDLPIPLYVSATDMEKGGQHIFSSGELVPALMASCAIPLVFPPVQVGGVHYVDGGISNNLPVEPFTAFKERVIAVHVNSLPTYVPGKQGMLTTMDRIWHLIFREMVVRSAKGCGLFIEPTELSRFNMFELGKMEEIDAIGYAWTKEVLSAAE
ncbi:MAG: patatin-like phospholipase family protein [Flavobacteriales bacterium]